MKNIINVLFSSFLLSGCGESKVWEILDKDTSYDSILVEAENREEALLILSHEDYHFHYTFTIPVSECVNSSPHKTVRITVNGEDMMASENCNSDTLSAIYMTFYEYNMAGLTFNTSLQSHTLDKMLEKGSISVDSPYGKVTFSNNKYAELKWEVFQDEIDATLKHDENK